MLNIDYKKFFLNYSIDSFLESTVDNYTDPQKKEIINAIENKNDEVFDFDNIKKIKIYGNSIEEFNDLNKNIIFFYKESFNNFQETRAGFLIYHENYLIDIMTVFPDDFSEVDEETRNIIFNVYCLGGVETDLEDNLTVEELREFIGSEIYEKIINIILKEENLLVKNSIYKIY